MALDRAILVQVRLALHQFARIRAHDQIAVGRNPQRAGALEPHRDPPGIGARGEYEIVFQMAFGTVEDQVDAGVDVFPLHPGEMRDIAQGRQWMAAGEVSGGPGGR